MYFSGFNLILIGFEGESEVEKLKKTKLAISIMKIIKLFSLIIAITAAYLAFNNLDNYYTNCLGAASIASAFVADFNKDFVLDPLEKEIESSLDRKEFERKIREALANFQLDQTIINQATETIEEPLLTSLESAIPLQLISRRTNTVSQMV